MSWGRFRGFLILALLAGAVYWYVQKRPTVAGFVEGLTRPIAGSKAAVKESERNRVIQTAVPAMQGDVEVPVGAIHEKMTYQEVRSLLGDPERIEEYVEEGRPRKRWHYIRAKRLVVFEEGRVLSIAVR
jgi:hypothetical protein